MSAPVPDFHRQIHLLYVPTLSCNLSCSYCYLGEQTANGSLREDAGRAVATLRTALARLNAAGVLAYNVSLHGGEPTLLPVAVLEELFTLIRQHYLTHFDQLTALGHRKGAPHLKTNLFKFAPLYELFDRHKVSISASIDLPLAMHARHRTLRGGESWIDRTLDNLRLLARYPHAKKVSATLCGEHLADLPALIQDIWFIHREIGFDMNQFNFMFAFEPQRAAAAPGRTPFTPATPAQQLALYAALNAAFAGTELEEGLRRNWFDEFKPSYCTNAQNCGERFFLMQSDGEVYSCVRGQGLADFHFGNLLSDPVEEVLANGSHRICAAHQRQGFDPACRECSYLPICRTGCAVVKHQHATGRSYTCELQQAIYADNPRQFPAAEAAAQRAYAREYAHAIHPQLSFELPAEPLPEAALLLPNDLFDEKNGLRALIAGDPILTALYSDRAFWVEINGELAPLASQLLKPQGSWHTLAQEDRLVVHATREIFNVNCREPVRNTLYVQMLRDTPVIYGDERRTKQAHLFTYQLFHDCLAPSDRLGPDYVMADLSAIIHLHRQHYRRGVLNNLFITTAYLREYHYLKQKNNAFYHLQAVNLPFQNVEFFYLS